MFPAVTNKYVSSCVYLICEGPFNFHCFYNLYLIQGFLLLKWPRWVRVLVTRMIAIGPTLSLAIISGANFSGWNEMLNVLQSLQLPFALIPIITFTGSYKIMGEFAMGRYAVFSKYCYSSFIDEK